jgi:hypothetical protein
MSKGKKPYWMPRDPAAWLADEALTLLSTAGRAIWFDLLCRMWIQRSQRGIIRGTADQLARLARCTGSEMESFLREAEQQDLCEVTRDSNGVVTLKDRGMLREEKVRKQTALRVAHHRQKTAKSSVTVPVTERDPVDRKPDNGEQIEEKVVPTDGAEAALEEQRPQPRLADLSRFLPRLPIVSPTSQRIG